MNATDPSLANILQTQGNLEHYHIPKYQREYTWGRNEWEQLLNDIDENDAGYFMGSIICIDDNSELGPGESRIYEVVDGQQRLTTISLLLMAIYSSFLDLQDEMNDDVDEEDLEDFKLTLSNIRKQLILKKASVNSKEYGYFKEKTKYCFLRVQPSTQRHNYSDYLHILNELDLLKGNLKSKFCGIRRIYKAYDYFYQHIPENLEGLNELLHKINSLKFIHIAVSSSSDAFTLFESLNNRGVPLSVMDIIKNKMLANLEKQHKMNIDDAYEDWQAMLEFLPEYKDQERFLRHYYNAFKVYPDKRIERYTRATKSNLITIFEQYIKKNAKDIFDDLLLKAESYNYLIEPEEYEENRQTKALIDLRRIGAAPSYLLLLYLYSIDVEYFSDKTNTLNEVLEFLVKYYVRRNITDIPNTRDLDGINIDVIEHCQNAIDSEKKLTSELIIEKLMTGKEKPASINKLKEGIEDNLFYYNAGMARYVLSKLDEISHSREYKPDLWARNDKGLLVWTVEHVFPQGNNIPDYWVDMIADGNKEKAEEIHEEWVHCLGNLTLSGYNSKLSNSSFEEKQSLHENKKFLGYKINIGYKNGLSLNDLKFDCNGALTSLANIETWTQKSIECRNDTMTNILLKLFSFTDDEISEIEIDE
jgi:uncharacterized protein with ParB-like and HNH nuclease domain